jgi:hypothetical protein
MVFAALLGGLVAAATPISVKNYGQELVDEAVRAHPDLLVVMLHVKLDPAGDNVVVASNIGRIGKLADSDDLRVIDTGTPNYEVSSSGTRFEAELPLLDVSGATVGAVGLVFPYRSGDDEAALKRHAEEIRDGLARRISSAANLGESYPYDPAATTATHARKLVDPLLEAHPDVLIVALHVTSPDTGENTIVASNIGRIGKPADADDLRVIRTGTPNLEPDATRHRFEAELPLLDKSGTTIGAIGLVFRYDGASDPATLAAKGTAIRDELRAQIESAGQLLQLDP